MFALEKPFHLYISLAILIYASRLSKSEYQGKIFRGLGVSNMLQKSSEKIVCIVLDAGFVVRQTCIYYNVPTAVFRLIPSTEALNQKLVGCRLVFVEDKLVDECNSIFVGCHRLIFVEALYNMAVGFSRGKVKIFIFKGGEVQARIGFTGNTSPMSFESGARIIHLYLQKSALIAGERQA